jgi:AraC-like DNA-binding protein
MGRRGRVSALEQLDEDDDLLRHAAQQIRHWTEVRNEQIRFARKVQGESLRTIAAAAGLSHTAVAKILNRTEG